MQTPHLEYPGKVTLNAGRTAVTLNTPSINFHNITSRFVSQRSHGQRTFSTVPGVTSGGTVSWTNRDEYAFQSIGQRPTAVFRPPPLSMRRQAANPPRQQHRDFNWPVVPRVGKAIESVLLYTSARLRNRSLCNVLLLLCFCFGGWLRTDQHELHVYAIQAYRY